MEESSHDVAVRRRLIFASLYLPSELPHYWDTVAKFASQIKLEGSITPESAKLEIENTKILNPEAFISDSDLTKQLIAMECNATNQHWGFPYYTRVHVVRNLLSNCSCQLRFQIRIYNIFIYMWPYVNSYAHAQKSIKSEDKSLH